MPFGTKEIVDSSREFAEAMKIFTNEIHNMNEQFRAMTAGFALFQQEMQTMTSQIKEMAIATNQMGVKLAEEIQTLNRTLQDLGKFFAQSIVENMKANFKEFVGFDKFKDLLPKTK